MKNENIKNFKMELKNLLKKYKAAIAFDCSDDSDICGIRNAKMIANINGEKIDLSYSWEVEAVDLNTDNKQ